jgi:hypothetical protein
MLTYFAGYIVRSDLGSDGVHTTNDGYRKMAVVWNVAIASAWTSDFIQAPEDTGISDDAPTNDCKKVAGKVEGPYQTQKGSGFDDGPYKHASTNLDGEVSDVTYALPHRNDTKRIAFAQLINTGQNPDSQGAIDDLVYFYHGPGEKDLWIDYRLNNPDGSEKLYMDAGSLRMPFDCPSDDVRWADVSICLPGSTGGVLQANELLRRTV